MTMYRYITLLWNRTAWDATKTADYIASKIRELSPHEWKKTWTAPGIVVYTSGECKGRMQTYHLARDSGVILGRLFRKDYSSVTEDLDVTNSIACIKTKGRHLIENYWGRYVAFFKDHDNSIGYIIRDPSGAFPCFHTPFQDIEIYFSDMQDMANFHFLPFTINWEYQKTNIALPLYQKTHTGLNEVGEILPAECLEITPFETNSRFLWDPTKISETNIVENPEEAADLLNKTVKETVGALAGCYNSVVHNLGGLDSSIILACLANAPQKPEITCINFFTKSPRGEERFYSRQVAAKFDAPLIETELDYRKVDLNKVFKSNKLASPLGFFDCIGLTGDVLDLAKDRNAEALFYGIGGDQVYYQPALNLGALDHVRRYGLFDKKTFRIAMEAARYSRKSLFKTLVAMLQEYINPAPCYNYVHNLFFENLKIPLINPEFIGTSGHEQFLHPLLIPDDDSLKGKYLHILMSALFSIEYYDHWDTNYYAERIHAYLTQPIIEACLRVPTWTLTYGGVERGLARKAFRSDLPQDILRRFSKSTPEEYYNDIYHHNIDFIREYLLDGIMVQERILLRDKVETALSGSDIQQKVIKFQLLFYLGTEAWLRGWIERPLNQNSHSKMVI